MECKCFFFLADIHVKYILFLLRVLKSTIVSLTKYFKFHYLFSPLLSISNYMHLHQNPLNIDLFLCGRC